MNINFTSLNCFIGATSNWLKLFSHQGTLPYLRSSISRQATSPENTSPHSFKKPMLCIFPKWFTLLPIKDATFRHSFNHRHTRVLPHSFPHSFTHDHVSFPTSSNQITPNPGKQGRTDSCYVQQP